MKSSGAGSFVAGLLLGLLPPILLFLFGLRHSSLQLAHSQVGPWTYMF